jgi:hypothetical protein
VVEIFGEGTGGFIFWGRRKLTNRSTTVAGHFSTLQDALKNRRRLWGLTLLDGGDMERWPKFGCARTASLAGGSDAGGMKQPGLRRFACPAETLASCVGHAGGGSLRQALDGGLGGAVKLFQGLADWLLDVGAGRFIERPGFIGRR